MVRRTVGFPFLRSALLSALAFSPVWSAARDSKESAPQEPVSGNAGQAGFSDQVTRDKDPVGGKPAPAQASAKAFTVPGTPSLSPDFINFAYIQSTGALPHVRWNALTHVGTTFISFNSTGGWVNLSSFTGRDSSMKAGGAAQNAGVKVIMVVLNDSFSSTVTNSVMQSSTNRATLISNVVSAVSGDSYCQGVSFDFEPFSYGTATRDGMVTFFADLRTAFNASSKPDAEISLYTDATYSSSNYNIPSLVPNIDYFNYSCYDWATGTTAHSVSDTDNYVSRVNTFLNVGIPASKMVLLDSSYGGDWPSMSSANYGATGGSRTAIGFCDGLFKTTIGTAFGGPFTANYKTGDEAGWYAYVNGTQHVATWEDPRALEYKMRLVQSFQDAGGANNGKRLRGVGWWSLLWFANFSTSYNPLPVGTPQGNTSKTRTYPQGYQLMTEILANPGTTKYLFEKFEQDNPRWATFASTQNSSPDNTNWVSGSTTRALITSPSGTGAPINSTKAMDVHFAFSGASAGKIFFRHEVLKDNVTTSVIDTNAMAAKVDINNAINAYAYSAAAYSGVTVRLVVMDKNRQLEASPAYTMGATGWQLLSWDMTSTAGGNVTGLTTAEPAFANGNGTIDTLGAGARDIGFVGFLIEKGASGSTTGDVYLDELSYEHKNPGGKNYKLNEFRYAGVANEFVEIQGPAGSFPSNLELRFYNPADGSVSSSVSLSGQTVPANGFFVVADPNVSVGSGTLYTPTGWTDSADNIANSTTLPGAVQLYDTVNGCVYDSLTYQAWGGLADLIRQGTNGVTAEGYGWIGEVSAGADASGAGHSAGRYPDGSDTNINEADFSSQRATPGGANGAQLSLPVVYDFETAPTNGAPFTSFGTYAVTAPPAGITHSGNAHRSVDTTGGGTMTVIGDSSTGSDGLGYNVSGDLYIQPTSARTAAQGVGFCGTQGTRFFTTSAANQRVSNYESGYWITFENNNGLSLADDQSDHGGTFQFIHATNDNQHTAKSTLLGSASLSTVGLSGYTAGGWTTFLLFIDPTAASGDQLIAKVNNVEIYHGAIPAGGPTKGGVMVGYREATGGTFASTDGTWVDNFVIASSAVPDPPSGLSATTVSQTQINLGWTDNSSDETGFIIGRSTSNGGPYTDIFTTSANATTYNNTTGLSANTTYYYVVRATNGGIDSSNSAQASATTLPNAPTAPSGLNATTISQTQINLGWTDNSSNETGFIIGRSTSSGGPYTDIFTTSANATTYNNTTGLSANTTYYYFVRATNTGGDSSNSSQASATTLPNVPTAPSGLNATTISQTQINLGWTDNSSNETGFIIGRATVSGGPYTDIFTTAANATTYNNTTGLSANTTYYYVVRATNTGGDSANGSQASATTLPNAPTAPSGLGATAISNSQIDLAWTDNSSNETGFVIARNYISGGSYTDIFTTAANATTYSDTTGLNTSTPYYYVVRAINTGGASANTSQATATTLQANRILNGSFENGFTSGVGNNWTSWTASGSAVLGFGSASVNKKDGSYSQYWNRADTAACDGGVYQVISVTPGATYNISAWMKRQSTFTTNTLKVGYDLGGGTSGTAGTVVYTDITGSNDTWNQYTASVTATGDSITIFARGAHTGTTGGASAYFYFDAVTVTGAGPRLETNGSFEGTFTSGVGAGWTSFITAGTPTFGKATTNKQDGAASQYWNRANTAAFDGGVRQTITTTAGQAYAVSVWMKRQSTLAGTSMKVGYDLSGGTSATAGSVVYTDITGATDNVWVHYTATFTATGSSTTLFARGGHTGTTGGTTSYFYVDAVTVSIP
ncbi:hypothetical protein BH09SUM1_BH09SUM1_13390 [soil metagenome]